ncbi:radical SAM protein [Saccharicrinis aurantiacus]|uniref:radical SAM protein n=1 Tax=Saccharicrinis aurantiacus TaxID=1849719 RepID=UPI000838D95A|nr:radical SAM protein [Saccharicrinis aurantiacus]
MKYTGTTYRPPIEANTLLLQVTVGCSHNSCSFCTMYKDVPFKIEHIQQIEKDLQEAKMLYGSQKRIFLVNADAFVLSARRLKEISAKIIEYFPEMEVITMYASIKNIMGKSDQDLIELRNMRINDLWVGLESGSDQVIKHLNKGHTSNNAYEQLERLNKAGIRHNDIFMMGAGGKGKAIESAAATAALINKSGSNLAGVTSLGFFPGSQIAKEVQNGAFEPATELEILEEERKLIELIEVENMPFYGDHPINATRLVGILPQDKDRLIADIDAAIQTTDSSILNGVTERTTL